MTDNRDATAADDEELVWLKGTEGEVMAIRVDSRSTGGSYAVIEAVHEPDCCVPTHLHRNEEEHFLVLDGQYRIAIGDEIIEAQPGTRATVPRNTPHSWRNVATTQGRLLVVVTPGGFEQLAWKVQDADPADVVELAARYGCEILGPPMV